MMSQLSLRVRLMLAAAGLFLIGLVLGWQTAVDGPNSTGLRPTRDEWSEPTVQHEDAAKLLAGLNQHSLWGEGGGGGAGAGPTAEEAAAAAAKAAAEWRLSGIVEQNGKSWAVIVTPAPSGKGAPHVHNSKIGDQLPDGSKLVAIAKTAITVADAKGQRQVKMFPSK